MEIVYYRITGPQSIERIDPLLHQLGEKLSIEFRPLNSLPTQEDGEIQTPLYFVWETYCEKEWKNYHTKALLLNKLSNSMVLEDKGNFAFLSLRINPINHQPLKSFIATNRSSLLHWCRNKWENNQNTSSEVESSPSNTNTFDLNQLATQSFLNEPFEWSLTTESLHSKDWWAVKATRGNGGKDVWIIHRDNYQEVIPSLPMNEEYVIQRYVSNPLLWNQKKFHFRCYGAVFGDHSGLLYEKGYILSASKNYENENHHVNDTQHLTNLSINKKYPGHPGQVPCWIAKECPTLFSQISTIWCEVITAASPFLSQQHSSTHFEFVGLDILCDSCGNCYLLEMNRCPGLESSNNRCKPQEEAMYDEMMSSFIEILITKRRLIDTWQTTTMRTPRQGTENGHDDDEKKEKKEQSDNNHNNGPTMDSNHPLEVNEIEVRPCLPSLQSTQWRCVRESSLPPSPPPPAAAADSATPPKTYENLFNWKAFTKRNRSLIVVDAP